MSPQSVKQPLFEKAKRRRVAKEKKKRLSLKWARYPLHNSPSKEFRLFNTILECTIYWYIYLYILYIAINISRITVDKYSGLLTIRGTSASFSTLLPLIFGCHRPQRRRRHLFFSYFIWLKFKYDDPNSTSFGHSSSTVSLFESSSFWSRTWGVGLGRAATSVVASEEGSCWSTILREDGSSCGKVRMCDQNIWIYTCFHLIRYT